MKKILCGWKSQPPGYSFSTACYDQLQVICVGAGELWFSVRETDSRLGPGGVLLLRPGSAFSLRCEGTGYRGVFLIAPEKPAAAERGTSLSLVAGPALQQVVRLLESELEGPPRSRSESLVEHLGRALLDLTLRLACEEGGGEPRDQSARYWANRVRLVLERSLYGGGPLHELFDGWDLGYRQLSRHFRSVYGISPKQYQLCRRLEQGAQLLVGSDLSVTAIAMELGFPSSQHFATQFARSFGASPTTYRRDRRRAASPAVLPEDDGRGA
jgi:AraC-like DNA-binding protein